MGRRTIKDNTFSMITVGQVIDTNDPKQMGRIRVQCTALGDTDDTLVRDLPWASYVSPLAGFVERGSRGRGDDTTVGPVAYGMWNIPKIGALALVACLDGDPRLRIWIGCLHGELLTHTMPHGRFSVRDDLVEQTSFDSLTGKEGKPIGPFSSREEAIQPQFDNLQEAFTSSEDNVGAGVPTTPQINFEYTTRGADQSVSSITEQTLQATNASFLRDDREDKYTEPDGNEIESTQGYQQSRIEPNLKSEVTGKTYDSQIYSWSTPGFHAIAMDDSSTNCRMRFRTTHGHQIILDDTNERIYISVAGGKCWIEMDEKGNMDFYAERNIAFHAEKDINFTAGDTFRVKAKNGIHMVTEVGDVRLHAVSGGVNVKAVGDFNMQTTGSLNINSGDTVNITATNDVNIKAGGTLNIDAGADVDILAGGVGIFDAATSLNLNSAGNVLITGTQIHHNGPPAATGSPATAAGDSTESWWTNRIPEHEPWPRVMTKATITDLDVGNTHNGSAEFTYDQTEVGREERGFDLTRNKNWHR